MSYRRLLEIKRERAIAEVNVQRIPGHIARLEEELEAWRLDREPVARAHDQAQRDFFEALRNDRPPSDAKIQSIWNQEYGSVDMSDPEHPRMPWSAQEAARRRDAFAEQLAALDRGIGEREAALRGWQRQLGVEQGAIGRLDMEQASIRAELERRAAEQERLEEERRAVADRRGLRDRLAARFGMTAAVEVAP